VCDYLSVKCDEWQAAISAAIDDEAPGVSQRLVEAHLAGCPSCRAFRAAAEHAASVVVAYPQSPVLSLASRVAKRAAVADRAAQLSIVRVLLLVVAVQIIAFSLPALVLGDEQNTSAHAARHLGAFTAAYGVALVVVAVRPTRARTMLPVAAVLAGALIITAIVDMVNGHIPLVGETQHIPELLSVVLIWMMTVPGPRRRSKSGAESIGYTPLRIVDDERAVG